MRQALEFKGILYEDELLELPDIAAFGKSAGLAPNNGPDKPYTVPILHFPDGTYVMNSLSIVEAIQKYQPEPALEMGPYERSRTILRGLMQALFSLFAPPALKLFHPESRAHWAKSVTPPGAASLDDWLSTQDPQAAWAAAEPALIELKQLLEEKPGPYLLGNEPSFADMVLAAFWTTNEIVCPDVFKELGRRIPAITSHEEACRSWQKD